MNQGLTPIIIGCFGKSFGVSGWIKVISFTSPEENILELTPWLIKKDGSWQEFFFEESKKQANGVVVKLPNCNSPEKASLFTNIEIGILRERLPELEGDEYYWHDIVGLKVINKDGVDLGVVKEMMSTGANDVLVVKGKKRILIPYVSHVIGDTDLDKKIIRVDWEGD